MLYVIDFESRWDTEYTLRKMTTDGYVLDPRFKAHGLGMRWPDGSKEWIRGPDIPAALQRVDWENAAVLAHNCAFDGFILTHRYGCPQPKWWLDTMSMARGVFGPDVSASLKEVAAKLGLGEKGTELDETKGLITLPPDVEERLARYCLNDVELCYRVFQALRRRMPGIELKLIDLTIRMFVRPRIILDTEMLEEHYTSEQRRKAELIAKLGVTKAQLNSAEQLAALFRRLGVKPPTKPSPKDPSRKIYAFAKSDPAFQALLEDERDEVRWLAEARLGVRSTIEESRTGRLLEVARAERPWPVMLNYYGAHCVTGDVEVLTPAGWCRLDQWEGGPIAQVDEAQRVAFLPAERFVGPVESRWLEVRAPYLDASFTLGHTMPYLKHRTLQWGVVQAGAFAENSTRYVPLAGVFVGAGAITPEQMRVLAMVQADGSFEQQASRGRGLKLHLKKPRKIERARRLLSDAGVRFREQSYPSHPGYVRFIVSASDCPAWLRPERKRFGPWLLDSTPEAREALVEELPHWDGWTQAGQVYYSTSEVENAEWVQTVCHLTGRCASVRAKERGDNRATNYVVALRQRARGLVRRSHLTYSNEPRRTYCTLTKTGFWLARRDGRIFVTGNTGRWSGGNKSNPQNVGRKSVLRRAITAPKGYVIGVCDSSQIEARMAARLAGQMDLVDVFRRGDDPYCGLASRVFRRTITKANKLERQVGKVGRLAFQYGQGWFSAACGLLSGSITQGYGPIVFDKAAAEAFGANPRWLLKPRVAERVRQIPATLPHADVAIHALATAKFVWTYRDESPFIVDYWGYLNGLIPVLAGGGRVEEPWFALEDKGITLPNGMRIEYHGLRQREGDWFYLNRKKPVKLYGGKVLENIVQALARIVVAEQMVRIAERYEVVTMTHDEVVFLMPEAEAEEGMAWALEIMHQPPSWMPDLPVAAEGGFAHRYADAKA